MEKFADSYIENGGAVFSSKKLRKALKEQFCRNSFDRSYVDMADVFGYLFEVTYYKAERRTLALDGTFVLRTKVIADAISLPDRRIREIIYKLADIGLIQVSRMQGYANEFCIMTPAYDDLIKNVKFDCEENEELKSTYIQVPKQEESGEIF